MNLIKREIKPSVINEFRKYQYSLWKDLIINGVNYLIKFGLNYDRHIFNPSNPQINIIPDLSYCKIAHYATKIVKLQLESNTNKPLFLQFSFPELIDDIFFKLNNVLYIPMVYILDEPIVIKVKSIALKSLFQPITIFLENNRVIFMGINIHIEDFFQFMTYTWSNSEKVAIQQHLSLDLNIKKIDTLISFFASKLNTEKEYIKIKKRINELFFDDYTYDIYKKFYNIEPDIDTVLKIAIKRKIDNTKIEFIDLRYKRLSFIEPILTPFFKAVRLTTTMLIKGQQVRNTLIPFESIIKNFFNELHGEIFYDTVNGLTSILAHKASFKNPYSTESLPSIVSSIHPTHKGRICPNTISNHNPGEMVSLIPNQKIDFETGRFIFSEQELKELEEYDMHK